MSKKKPTNNCKQTNKQTTVNKKTNKETSKGNKIKFVSLWCAELRTQSIRHNAAPLIFSLDSASPSHTYTDATHTVAAEKPHRIKTSTHAS